MLTRTDPNTSERAPRRSVSKRSGADKAALAIVDNVRSIPGATSTLRDPIVASEPCLGRLDGGASPSNESLLSAGRLPPSRPGKLDPFAVLGGVGNAGPPGLGTVGLGTPVGGAADDREGASRRLAAVRRVAARRVMFVPRGGPPRQTPSRGGKKRVG